MDGIDNNSNVKMTISENPDHYQANRDARAGLDRPFHTDGYQLMKQMNRIYGTFKNDTEVWNDMWSFGY